MTAPLLSLRGISRSYGQIKANQAIDLDVAPQSIHAILGENGAGKSTLMKLIYGVEQPDDGTVAWNGEPLTLASPAEARRKGIGMVFQHFSLFETLTVVENIRLVVPGRKADLIERIRALGRDFGLEVDPLAHVHALSVGERQRVEIIRCLMTDPKLLILDEPTSVLPPQAVDKLFDTLRRLRDRGVSILFISHKLEEIRAICDRATILRAGRVTGNVDPREHDAHDLARMMIGRDMPEPMPAEVLPEGEKEPSAIFASISLIFVIVSAGISGFQSVTATTLSETPRKVLAPLNVPARCASTEALKKGDQSVAMQPRYFAGAYFFIEELRLKA